MLERDTLSERLGGIDILARLANDYPDRFHINVMELFCAFVRNPPADSAQSAQQSRQPHDKCGNEARQHVSGPRLREDVQKIVCVIGARSTEQRDVEMRVPRNRGFTLDLTGADLRGLILNGARLPTRVHGSGGAHLYPLLELNGADLFGARLDGVDLSGVCVRMDKANLSNATLIDVNCASSFMNGVTLSGATILRGEYVETKLEDSHLVKAVVTSADLSGAHLNRSHLDGMKCTLDVKLCNAKLREAKLPRADLCGADVCGAYMFGAVLSGTLCSAGGDRRVRHLTQIQLDSAWPMPNSPPVLTDLLDPVTSRPLMWDPQKISSDRCIDDVPRFNWFRCFLYKTFDFLRKRVGLRRQYSRCGDAGQGSCA